MSYSLPSRRSTADVIFQQLRDEIMALDILPGTKLSEAEVAEKFGVSRQPVREALNLLSSENLVEIQPQKATRVGRFSLQRIEAARFARRALEIELIREACSNWSEVYRPGFERCLHAQSRAVADHDSAAFHGLDEDFHRLLAEAACAPFAFEQIKGYKAHVDRICVLSLKNVAEIGVLVDDHRAVFEAVASGDVIAADSAMRLHLSRIEKTIEVVRQSNAGYFDT